MHKWDVVLYPSTFVNPYEGGGKVEHMFYKISVGCSLFMVRYCQYLRYEQGYGSTLLFCVMNYDLFFIC